MIELEDYIESAIDAGCPADQLENFARVGITLQPRQLLASAAARLCDRPDGPTTIGFGGARGGGKSHWLFAQMGADDCQRVPGLKCLLLRKVGKSNLETWRTFAAVCFRIWPMTSPPPAVCSPSPTARASFPVISNARRTSTPIPASNTTSSASRKPPPFRIASTRTSPPAAAPANPTRARAFTRPLTRAAWDTPGTVRSSSCPGSAAWEPEPAAAQPRGRAAR